MQVCFLLSFEEVTLSNCPRILQASASRDGVLLITNATGILEELSSMLKPKASARLIVHAY